EAVDGMVSQQLRKIPVGILEVGSRQDGRFDVFRARLLRAQQDFQADVEGTAGLVGGRTQVWQGLRVARIAFKGDAEGCQRFQRDDPGGNGAGKVLGQKRSQRLVFPRLQIACRPVVQDA